jgi:quercetin dioxygenase-like cupin family protein
MDIKPGGSQPSRKGPDEYFTGAVRIEALFEAPEPARVVGASVTFAPGEKHWHGATPTRAMTHTAIQERLDGKTVEWLEKVSDDQYSANSSSG